jgi:tyrosine-protein phosphatase YwqE
MIVKENQSTFDLATQISGDVKSVLDYCIKNEISLTEKIPAGFEFKKIETIYKNDLVLNYFSSKSIELATDGVFVEAEVLGIGTMIIETNFDIL